MSLIIQKKFPKHYAICKDLDMLASSTDYPKIKYLANNYFKQYGKHFQIEILEEDNNFRLRMEENNKLHYQIDITINNELIENKKE